MGCACVLVFSFHSIMACVPGGRVGGGGLIQWGTGNKYFCGVYSQRNTMDGLDLDIAFAMTKHFSNKISPMHNFIVPLQIGLVCYLLA